jgi:hypothetical protein
MHAAHPLHQSLPGLVDLSLVQVVDDPGAVKQAAVAGARTAQRVAALNDVVVALQVGLLDAAEGAAAVVSAGNAAALLAVGGGAGVLLQAGVGHAALAVGHGAVLVLALDQDGVAGRVLDALDVDDAGRGDGDEAEEDRGEGGELHVGRE